jgi:hypothetical protein
VKTTSSDSSAQPSVVTAAEKPNPKNVDKSKPEKLRVELNVEKWPALWRPASSKTTATVRTLERELNLSDGSRGTSKLEIGFTQLGTTTTEDQKMFYALIRNWEENGKPADRPVFFSDRLLARLLKKKGWGTNVIDAITGSLRRLRLTPLRWINSYHKNDGSGKVLEEETLFNFLDTLKIVTRREHGHVTNQQGYYQFDRNILINLLANYTKPLLDEEFFKLQTEIGQLLYTHLDLIMFDKGRYERCTKDLFRDLGLLENPSYRYPSNRKQALRRPVAELLGKHLSRGVIKSISVERTKDNKDYKLVVVKGRATEAEDTEGVLPEPATAVGPVVINHYLSPKTLPQQEAEELVQYFYKLFHKVDKHTAQSKETSQAQSLISQHGLEMARKVVDFAHAEAATTNFRIQHFGAILNYASRAIAADERAAADTSPPQWVPTVGMAEKPEWVRGQARLAILTEQQAGARMGQAQAELFAAVPFLAQRPRPDSQLHQDMIRSRLLRQLDSESMELVIADFYSFLPTGLELGQVDRTEGPVDG